MKQTDYLITVMLGMALSVGGARAQLIDSYNADSQSLGSLGSFTDLTGSHTATETAAAALSASVTVNPTVGNIDTAFNGHHYVEFLVNSGLATTSIYSGTNPRSLAVVFDSPKGDLGNVSVVAGQSSLGGNPGAFFAFVAKNGTNGSPDLQATPDLSSGVAPATDQLVFALGTFDGSTETLYYAFGTSGVIHTLSNSDTTGTANNPFLFGFNAGQTAKDNMNIGQVLVYNSSLTGTQADSEIASLQAYYIATAPEPATYAMLLAGLALLGFVVRPKSNDCLN